MEVKNTVIEHRLLEGARVNKAGSSFEKGPVVHPRISFFSPACLLKLSAQKTGWGDNWVTFQHAAVPFPHVGPLMWSFLQMCREPMPWHRVLDCPPVLSGSCIHAINPRSELMFKEQICSISSSHQLVYLAQHSGFVQKLPGWRGILWSGSLICL